MNHPWDTSHFPYIELAETLFPVESTNNIRVTSELYDMDAFGAKLM